MAQNGVGLASLAGLRGGAQKGQGGCQTCRAPQREGMRFKAVGPA